MAKYYSAEHHDHTKVQNPDLQVLDFIVIITGVIWSRFFSRILFFFCLQNERKRGIIGLFSVK